MRKRIKPFVDFDDTTDSNQEPVPYRDLKSHFEKHRVDVKNIFQGFLDEGFNYLIYFSDTKRSVTNIISISMCKQCGKGEDKTDTNIMVADNLSESLNRLKELGFEIDSMNLAHRASKITTGGKTIEIQVQLS